MGAKWLLILALGATAQANRQSATNAANPIRKVVNMLQSMQAKVTAENEAEKELHEKFMCYCKTGGSTLAASISAADTKIPQLASDIKEAEEQLAQTKDDLTAAQADRAAANTAMKEATAIRQKEAATFAAFKAESETNVNAIAKAVAALEKGAAGSFLQSAAGSVVRKLAQSKLEGEDQEQLLSFLSGSTEYAPQSGQVTGILKTMGDEMSAGLADATATENTAIQNFDELMAAKKKEVAALQKSIEAKMQKIGELGVSIAQMKNDLTDTEEGLIEDKKFLADLEKSCDTAQGDFEANQKVRGEELLALADTIKILNDDDALELFKKTLPGSAASLMQLSVSTVAMRARALEAIQAQRSPRLDFIALALRGKKIGFEKVIGMIDAMVGTLKQEQLDDDSKKEYCDAQFDESDDKKKAVERALSDAKTAIAKTEEAIATTTEEIAALVASIAALDKSVAEATELRKEENAEYKELMASNGAAKDIMGFAKNRLNKFYNPKLYKPPAKKELSRDDRIVANMGGASFVQVSAHKDAPPPPPAAVGAYKKSSEESGGVIAMIDLLVKDLDKEMTVAKTEETDAQGDYEQAMSDSAEKRAQDSKTLTDKEGAKADMESDLEAHKATKASTTKELAATLQYIASLHAECDWLIQYFEVRKEARTGEIDSLVKAKAVLSGADYSLVQTRKRTFLETRSMGPCVDMCATVHPKKTSQDCQRDCGKDVTYATGTSRMCMDMCQNTLDLHEQHCANKCKGAR